VKAEFKRVENSEAVTLDEVFDYIYKERTPILQAEYNEIKKRNEEVK